jgi:hypothetical protein
MCRRESRISIVAFRRTFVKPSTNSCLTCIIRYVRSPPQRFLVLIVLLPLAWWLYLQARSSWRGYWLLKDGQQAMAVLTEDYWGGHGQVVYRYTVNEQLYTGVSSRNWKDERYSKVKIGEQAAVYFSASHPWLSLLYKPDSYLDVLPALIASTLVFFVVLTAVNPRSKWAFNLDDKR